MTLLQPLEAEYYELSTLDLKSPYVAIMASHCDAFNQAFVWLLWPFIATPLIKPLYGYCGLSLRRL
jgi:hypothetical protein